MNKIVTTSLLIAAGIAVSACNVTTGTGKSAAYQFESDSDRRLEAASQAVVTVTPSVTITPSGGSSGQAKGVASDSRKDNEEDDNDEDDNDLGKEGDAMRKLYYQKSIRTILIAAKTKQNADGAPPSPSATPPGPSPSAGRRLFKSLADSIDRVLSAFFMPPILA